MSQFIYRLQLNRPAVLTEGPTEPEAAVLSEHVAYLARLAEEGTVLLAGRTQTDAADGYGIVLLSAGSEHEAQQVMESDPAVREGVMRAQLHPYRIAVLSESIVAEARLQP